MSDDQERDAVDIGTDNFFEEVRELDASEGVEGETPTTKNMAVIALSRLVTLESEHQDLVERVEELERQS